MMTHIMVLTCYNNDNYSKWRIFKFKRWIISCIWCSCKSYNI